MSTQRKLLEDLQRRQAQAEQGGGEARIARQREKGKLTAHERLDLLLDERAGLIHVRSASRRGWSDLGVNRRRVESLRESLAESILPIQ